MVGAESINKIYLSIFYFTGENKQILSDNTPFDVGEEFLAQVRMISKSLH